MRKTIGIVGTVSLHLVLVIGFLFSPPLIDPHFRPRDSGGGEDRVLMVTLINSTAVEIDDDKKTEEETVSFLGTGGCPPEFLTYIGVGFVYDMNTGLIIQAPPHLPAYQAGIRIGDAFLDYDLDTPIVDGYRIIRVQRYDSILVFKIKVKRICHSKDGM